MRLDICFSFRVPPVSLTRRARAADVANNPFQIGNAQAYRRRSENIVVREYAIDAEPLPESKLSSAGE